MIINGNSYEVLKRLEDNSMHFCITSPPYFSPVEGLRDYQPDCVVEWPDGWIGILGSEPTPSQYISHSLLIYKEVFRALRPMGTFALNIGDTRAGSGRGPSGKSAMIKNQEERQGFVGKHQKIPDGFKRKDMFAMPFRMGIALQEMGFYWRDCIPWLKRNGAIASYRDRPVSSIEWILILSKTERNYYDYVGVMQQASESYNKDKRPRGVLRQRVNAKTKYSREEPQYRKQDDTGNQTYTGLNARFAENGSCDKRLLRSSDFFFKTWQGLWCDEEGEPLALIVNPSGHLWKHTAGFPVLLPQTLIEAYTSEKNCSSCGSPWERVSHKEYSEDRRTYQIITDGWQPTCRCGVSTTMKATVLDPFCGTSATGVACKNTKRNYLGIEISKKYAEMSEERVKEGK